MTICRQCKHCRVTLFVNGLALMEEVCSKVDEDCKDRFYINPVTGYHIYTKCSTKNHGDCRDWELGRRKLWWSAQTTNA